MTIGTFAVVWVDQEQARSIFLDGDTLSDEQPSARQAHSYRRARVGNPDDRRSADDHIFFQRIANDLAIARRFLVIGPAEAKARFAAHLRRFDPRLVVRMRAIETAIALADDALVMTARDYFQWSGRPSAGQETQRQ